MNREQVVRAMHSNKPFRIRMADGKEYRIPHQDYISISPRGTFVVIHDEHEDRTYSLPLLTMTGLVEEGVSSENGTPPAAN